MIYNNITECDIYIRRDLYHNIILSGGNTCFKGLPTRLEKELNMMTPQPGMINITASPDRHFSVWAGGIILASFANIAGEYIYRP